VALHLTGQYPTWWNGRRFDKPTRGWIIGPTAQLVRDGPQRQVCTRQGEFGSGTIPLAAFASRPVMIPGGTGGIDTLKTSRDQRRTRRPIVSDLQILRNAGREAAGRVGRLDMDR
jgi:hypothetical protein